MAETPKLSVEKALNKLRAADAQKSTNTRRTEKMEELDEENQRLRAQRIRLDWHKRHSTCHYEDILRNKLRLIGYWSAVENIQFLRA